MSLIDRVVAGKHASTHVLGGSDAITSKLDYGAMNIICVKGVRTTNFSTTSTSYVDLGLSVSITLPVNSNVLVFMQVWRFYNDTAGYRNHQRIVRDTTSIRIVELCEVVAHFNNAMYTLDVNVAAGTHTYKIQVCVGGGTGNWLMSSSPYHGEIIVIAFPY